MTLQPTYELVEKFTDVENKYIAITLSRSGFIITSKKVNPDRYPGWSRVKLFEAKIESNDVSFFDVIYYEEGGKPYCTSTSDYSPERDLLIAHLCSICRGAKGVKHSEQTPPKYVKLDKNTIRVNDFPNSEGDYDSIVGGGIASASGSLNLLMKHMNNTLINIYLGKKITKASRSFHGNNAVFWKYFYDFINHTNDHTYTQENEVDVVVVKNLLAPRGMDVYVKKSSNETKLYKNFFNYIIELCGGEFKSYDEVRKMIKKKNTRKVTRTETGKNSKVKSPVKPPVRIASPPKEEALTPPEFDADFDDEIDTEIDDDSASDDDISLEIKQTRNSNGKSSVPQRFESRSSNYYSPPSSPPRSRKSPVRVDSPPRQKSNSRSPSRTVVVRKSKEDYIEMLQSMNSKNEEMDKEIEKMKNFLSSLKELRPSA